MEEKGMLCLCATPIGNLEDITLRVLRTLRRADLIVCEDTRNSAKLLARYAIRKPLQSFHDFSGDQAAERIADQVAAGKLVCFISDAGMPGVSDPGFELVKACRARGLAYTVLPGASASVTALVASGLPSDRFLFEGFLPRKSKDRQARLRRLDDEEATVLIYESPHRLRETLEEFASRWPTRQVACVREISKRYEEVVRGSLEEVRDHFTETEPRGEFVIVLGAAPDQAQSGQDGALAFARLRMQEGASLNQAAKEAAKAFGLSKRSLYEALNRGQDQ
jgi:16S rRNA (cytidine1402-2'-O)-methyltransferase